MTFKKKRVINVMDRSEHSPTGFTKAFVRFHGVTPNKVKSQGAILKSFHRLRIKIILEGGNTMDFRIEKKDGFQVVAKTRYFNEESSKTEVPKFWEEYYQSKLYEKVCGRIGICSQAKDNAREWKYGIGSMPQAIQEQWKRVYGEWLPTSNYELVPDYDIEFYTEGDTDREDYVSEIWIPVKEK